jgi:TonB-linked SusC/RagA family outer membrane protein
MQKKLLCFILSLFASFSVAMAQVSLSGVVKDKEGPLAGASVVLKGTTVGVITGSDGTFKLSAPNAKTAVLVIKFIGMIGVEYPVNGKPADIKIFMQDDMAQIDDVVVVGYGNALRSNLTGSVGSISSKMLAVMPVSSAAEAMVGKIAGVQVTVADGSPGSEINIRIRGGTSVTQSNQPLFVVDGFPVDNINDIPPTDIQSIDVLKDASLTAIYGARGGNGVVIVTTKAAKTGKITLSFNHYTQIRTLANKLDVMNPYEFVKLQYENAVLGGNSTRLSFRNSFGNPLDIPLYKRMEGNDWQNDVLGGHPLSSYYNVNIGGGSDKLRLNFSLSHNDERGVLIGSGIKKTNLIVKLSANISPKIKFEYNPRVYYQQKEGLGTTGMSVLNALRYRPINGMRDFSFIPADELDPEEEKNFIYNSPSGDLTQNYQMQDTYTITNQGAFTWEIVNGMILRSEGGYTFGFNVSDRFYGTLTGDAQRNNNQPIASIIRGRNSNYRWANTLTYTFSVKNHHHLSGLVGQEIINSKSQSNFTSVRYLPTQITANVALANFSLGSPWMSTTYYSSPDRTMSYFGRLSYNYNQKYLLSGTFRADASTKFAPGNQWGYFPAISGAWIISKENFMTAFPAFSLLKLRAAIGASGNNRISDDMWRYQFSVSNSQAPGWGEINDIGWEYYRNSDAMFPNDKIKWETTLTRSGALDIEMFKNKLTITPEIYWNTTSDLLYRSQIPITSGYINQMQNIGQVTNRGWELTIAGTILQKKNFTLNGNFNFGANKTRIDKLNDNETQFFTRSGWAGENDYLLQVGGELGLIYGYVYDGFYKIDDFDYNYAISQWVPKEGVVNSYAMFGTTPGAPKYKNLVDNYEDNPNDKNIINQADMTVIGNTNPRFGGGFGLDGVWKNFDFTIFFNYLYKFDVNNVNKFRMSSWLNNKFNNLFPAFNEDKRFRYVDDTGFNMMTTGRLLGEFISVNETATIYNPRTVTRGITHSYAIEDGSFLRLQNVTVGYTLPQKFTNKLGISKLRGYFTGYNLFLLTRYSGYDPEVNVQNGLTPGIDDNVYPRSRMYTFGVNLSF